MIRTKFRDLTIEDVTPKNRRRREVNVYYRKVFVGHVSWSARRQEYFFFAADLSGWNRLALMQFTELVKYMDEEYGK